MRAYGNTPWCNRDGFPRSWAHYVHGLRHLGRAHLREQLAQAQAVRIGQHADEKGYARWQRAVSRQVEG